MLQKWVKARDEADFSQFAPVLQEWVDLLKKYAGAIDTSRPIYDVLLDDFEKGMTTSRLDEIFTEVITRSCFRQYKGIQARGKEAITEPDTFEPWYS